MRQHYLCVRLHHICVKYSNTSQVHSRCIHIAFALFASFALFCIACITSHTLITMYFFGLSYQWKSIQFALPLRQRLHHLCVKRSTTSLVHFRCINIAFALQMRLHYLGITNALALLLHYLCVTDRIIFALDVVKNLPPLPLHQHGFHHLHYLCIACITFHYHEHHQVHSRCINTASEWSA